MQHPTPQDQTAGRSPRPSPWLVGFALRGASAEPGKLLDLDQRRQGLQRPGQGRRGVHQEDRRAGRGRTPRRRTRQVPAGRRRRQGPRHLDLAARPHRRVDRRRPAADRDPAGKKVAGRHGPARLEGLHGGGKTWGYPLSIEAVALVYNKRPWCKNPPKTFEEIVALDKKLLGLRQEGHPLGLQQHLLHLAAAGAPTAATCSSCKAARRPTTRPTPASTTRARSRAPTCCRVLIKNGVMPKGARLRRDGGRHALGQGRR